MVPNCNFLLLNNPLSLLHAFVVFLDVNQNLVLIFNPLSIQLDQRQQYQRQKQTRKEHSGLKQNQIAIDPQAHNKCICDQNIHMHLSEPCDSEVVLNIVVDIVALSLDHTQACHQKDDDPGGDYDDEGE